MIDKNAKLKFIENKLSFWLIMIALVLLVGITLELSISWQPFGVNGEGVLVSIDILINIATMLMLFLVAEKQKKYMKSGAYLGIALSIFNIVHMLTVPFELHKRNSTEVIIISSSQLTGIVIKMTIISLLVITASIITIVKHQKLKKVEL